MCEFTLESFALKYSGPDYSRKIWMRYKLKKSQKKVPFTHVVLKHVNK